MVMYSQGQLVPYPITPADPNAPYGYIKDASGKLIPAKSLEEAKAAAQAAVAGTAGAGTASGGMVLNAQGQLVPAPITPHDPNAPYGYVKDASGKLVPAKSPAEAAAAAKTAAGNMVMNSQGQLVPYPITPADPNAPYGYIKDASGKLVPAKSLEEAKAAAQAAVAGTTGGAGATGGGVGASAGSSGGMVLNAQGQLVPAPITPPDPNAPYGYVKDASGKLVPAKSPAEAAAAAKTAAGNMVMNAQGQLVPYPITPADPNAPYGYVKDASGKLVPAKSLEEAKAAAQTAVAGTAGAGTAGGGVGAGAGSSGGMVLNAQGQLVPAPITPPDPNAPYGYVKDASGKLVPAKSPAEAAAAAKTAAGNMVMNAQGQLVPYPITPPDPNAPYGYVKDASGKLVPAKSLEEAKAAAQTAVAGTAGAGAASTGSSGGMVLNAQGQLVPAPITPPDPNAPYGYVKDASGKLVPAKSPAEAAAAAKTAAGNMVMNAQGQLVPYPINPPDANAPYGYVKDASGKLVPAKSLEEAKAVVQAIVAGVVESAKAIAGAVGGVGSAAAGGANGTAGAAGVGSAAGNAGSASAGSAGTGGGAGTTGGANGAVATADTAAAIANASPADLKNISENVIMNSAGELVPKGSITDPNAPYGYVKDANGNLVPAQTPAQAAAAVTSTIQSAPPDKLSSLLSKVSSATGIANSVAGLLNSVKTLFSSTNSRNGMTSSFPGTTAGSMGSMAGGARTTPVGMAGTPGMSGVSPGAAAGATGNAANIDRKEELELENLERAYKVAEGKITAENKKLETANAELTKVNADVQAKQQKASTATGLSKKIADSRLKSAQKKQTQAQTKKTQLESTISQLQTEMNAAKTKYENAKAAAEASPPAVGA
jgi:mannose-1-phosphate guanylyltransferase